jgi:hypothetical protein
MQDAVGMVGPGITDTIIVAERTCADTFEAMRLGNFTRETNFTAAASMAEVMAVGGAEGASYARAN